jgi:hypothetical protein
MRRRERGDYLNVSVGLFQIGPTVAQRSVGYLLLGLTPSDFFSRQKDYQKNLNSWNSVEESKLLYGIAAMSFQRANLTCRRFNVAGISNGNYATRCTPIVVTGNLF